MRRPTPARRRHELRATRRLEPRRSICRIRRDRHRYPPGLRSRHRPVERRPLIPRAGLCDRPVVRKVRLAPGTRNFFPQPDDRSAHVLPLRVHLLRDRSPLTHLPVSPGRTRLHAALVRHPLTDIRPRVHDDARERSSPRWQEIRVHRGHARRQRRRRPVNVPNRARLEPQQRRAGKTAIPCREILRTRLLDLPMLRANPFRLLSPHIDKQHVVAIPRPDPDVRPHRFPTGRDRGNRRTRPRNGPRAPSPDEPVKPRVPTLDHPRVPERMRPHVLRYRVLRYRMSTTSQEHSDKPRGCERPTDQPPKRRRPRHHESTGSQHPSFPSHTRVKCLVPLTSPPQPRTLHRPLPAQFAMWLSKTPRRSHHDSSSTHTLIVRGRTRRPTTRHSSPVHDAATKSSHAIPEIRSRTVDSGYIVRMTTSNPLVLSA